MCAELNHETSLYVPHMYPHSEGEETALLTGPVGMLIAGIAQENRLYTHTSHVEPWLDVKCVGGWMDGELWLAIIMQQNLAPSGMSLFSYVAFPR